MPRRSSRTPGCSFVKPAHVQLVDHGLVPRRLERPVALPVEARVDRRRSAASRPRRRRRRARRRRRRPAYGMHVGGVPATAPSIALAYGIEQELGRVEAVPVLGRVGPVDAVAVALARADAGQVAVPVERGALRSARTRCSRSSSSNRQSSTRSACSEKTEKFVPSPSQVAPSGNGRPGQTLPAQAPSLESIGPPARARRRRAAAAASSADHALAVPGASPRPRSRPALPTPEPP